MVLWLLTKLALVAVGKSCGCFIVDKVVGVLGLGQMELVVVVVCEMWLLVVDGWCVVVLGLVVVGSVVVALETLLWLFGGGVVHQFFLQTSHCPYLHGLFCKGWCTTQSYWHFTNTYARLTILLTICTAGFTSICAFLALLTLSLFLLFYSG